MKAASPNAKTAAGASRPGRRDRPEEGKAGADRVAPEASVTPGLAMMEEAVRFTSAQVLDPTRGLSGAVLPTGMDLGANALAEQAAVMMIQDMRSFLQSMEMIMVPAAASALSQSLEGDPAGAATLTLIQSTMGELSSFAGSVIVQAGATRTVFT
ncbi:MAG: hypothetical protein QOJ91_1936 [Sphingomonadales bacterium]|nr:hypothetical protein [Sphingomonadales bacterium]